MMEFNPVAIEKAGLAKQSQTDRAHPLSKTGIGRKCYSIPKIDWDGVVIGNIGLAANAAGDRFGQFEDIQLQQNSQAQRKQTGICTGVKKRHTPDRLTRGCSKGRECQRPKCSRPLRMCLIRRQVNGDVRVCGLCFAYRNIAESWSGTRTINGSFSPFSLASLRTACASTPKATALRCFSEMATHAPDGIPLSKSDRSAIVVAMAPVISPWAEV